MKVGKAKFTKSSRAATHKKSSKITPSRRERQQFAGGQSVRHMQTALGNHALQALLRQPTSIEAKLRIGPANDRYEQEADRVADQVMRMPNPPSRTAGISTVPPRIQRLCPKCEEDMQRMPLPSNTRIPTPHIQPMCPQCKDDVQLQSEEQDEDEMLQRQPEEEDLPQRKDRAAVTPQITPGVESGIQSLKGGGRPLSDSQRAFFEPRFGRDFSHVRIHTDNRAEQTAQSINARAFTVGPNIAFGKNQYAPDTITGKQLLAHELTHTIQQNAQRISPHAIQRWRISGNEAVSNSHSDTLYGLARRVSGRGNNWKCIIPKEMKSSGRGIARFNSEYWRFVRLGDKFDLSNLKATSGTSLKVTMFDSTSRDGLLDAFFYPGIATSPNGDIDIDIDNTANGGQTPIQEFLLSGHAAGPRMFGAAVPGYEPANFNSEDPPPTFDQAELGFLPRRCWFTRNANVRSVGCNSLEFGEDFAAVFLRKGSSIVTTTANVRGSCRGLPFQIGTALGIPGGCAWFNGMNFSSGLSPSDPTIEGPFWSVADFHAASHWETVNGKL